MVTKRKTCCSDMEDLLNSPDAKLSDVTLSISITDNTNPLKYCPWCGGKLKHVSKKHNLL